MTTQRAGSADEFGEALFGADGTVDPIVFVESPPEIFGDPLAEATLDQGSWTYGSRRSLNRVAAPVALTNDAINRASRQLAAEQAQQRVTLQANQRQADQFRRAALERGRTVETQRAAQNAANRAGQQSQFANSYQQPNARRQQSMPGSAQPAPGQLARSLGRPGADERAALVQRVRTTTGRERRDAMRALTSYQRAARGKTSKSGKSSKGGWGAGVFALLLILASTGFGKEIVQSIVDFFNSGT